MHEVLLVLSGTIIGTVFIGAGVFLGAWLVKRTYSELTHPHPLLFKVEEQENTDTTNITLRCEMLFFRFTTSIHIIHAPCIGLYINPYIPLGVWNINRVGKCHSLAILATPLMDLWAQT